MPRIFVSIGSNIRPEENIALAIELLRKAFGELDISPVYRNAAVGFDGDDFLNLVVGFDSDCAVAEIDGRLDDMEHLAGREPGAARFAPRVLDIDLLLYGDDIIDIGKLRLPRADILRYAFVLVPLADIAPDLIHPVTGKSIMEHRDTFDGNIALRRVALPTHMPKRE